MPQVTPSAQSHQVDMTWAEHFGVMAASERRQEELLVFLDKRRKADAKAKSLLERANLAFARAEEELSRTYQRKIYEITQDPEWEPASIDPRTGTKTESWGEIVIEHLIAGDQEWMAAKKAYYDAQELSSSARQEAMSYQADLATIVDEMAVLKNRAIYRAALMFASQPIVIGGMEDASPNELPEGLQPRAKGKKGTGS